MLGVAVVVLASAAMLGLVLIAGVWRERTIARGRVRLHGLLAALGVGLVATVTWRHPGTPWTAVALLAVALSLGLMLASTDRRGVGPSKALALLHGLVAAGGIAWTLYVLASHVAA